MGFRTGAYATVWDVTPMSNTSTKIRISISKKNKQTGEYDQDFSGFVLCVGSLAAGNALKLTKNSKIKLGDCDVTTKYDAQKNTTYTNYKLFSFEIEGGNTQQSQQNTESQPTVDDGELDDSRLPF